MLAQQACVVQLEAKGGPCRKDPGMKKAACQAQKGSMKSSKGSAAKLDRQHAFISSLQYRNGYSPVVVHCGSAYKHIPNGCSLGFEASCCSHTYEQVRLVLLAGQVCGQRCWHCANIVHAVLCILACTHTHTLSNRQRRLPVGTRSRQIRALHLSVSACVLTVRSKEGTE